MTPISEEQQERNLKALCRHALAYCVAAIVPIVAAFLFALWALGYAMGYLDGIEGRPSAMQTDKESN